MSTRRRLRTIAGLVVLLGALLAVLPALDDAAAGRTHRAPVLLVGPEVVVGPLADDVDALPDAPFDAAPADDRAAAERALADGDVVAVVVVDLRSTEDTLLLPRLRTPELDRALVREVRAAEERRGRTVTVERAGPARDAPAYDVLGLAAAAGGFVLVLVVSLVWGPFARTLPRGLLRLVAVGALAAVAAGLAPLLPGVLGSAAAEVAAVLALGVLAAGLLTLALEAFLGLAGLLIGAAVLLVLPAPLLVADDPLLLPGPWADLVRWTSAGAAAEGVRDAAAGGGPGRALWFLGAVAATGLLVLALTRFDGVRHSPAATGSGRPADDVPTSGRWRIQLVAVLAALAAGTVLTLTLLPGADGADGDTAYPSLASATTCEPTGPVRTVADLNRITELRGSPQFRGGDVGAQAELQDGRRLWVFGDTLRGTGGEERFVRNSMLVVEPGCLRVVVPAGGGAVIPDRDREVGYWPMSVVVDGRPGYDLVTVTAQRVRSTDRDDAFGFENIGPAVALFVVPEGGTPQLVERVDVGPDSADTTRPMWGAAAERRDGWLHLYGTARPDTGMPTGFSLQVARVRPDDVLEPDRWRYWDGTAWVRDPTAAAELVPAAGGTSQTLSVFERDGRWYAFSKRDEFLGSDLVFWTAPAPTGPFTAQPPVAELPSDSTTGELRYMPLAHPGLLPRPRSVVVSYSRNRTDIGEVLDDPLLYRPRFLRVPLPVD
ncbi:DUF4185 domain-containing protein [Nocardioides deserti]|uniref:DUF4185 domain-containing protein n=1 Tax=Nocardioides deserti TaxID=1588644 RepID=A0ABR6U5P4_9ACTN|nr:DUF4185 domain-containing protein [Nocardioides deserti]MBC2959478.1 DUF4185 domain-containing protein [Nocardioides deserti]GGO73641.1 hypothetical protein GCM10012276_19760 [Nocardioides deserti]